MPDRMSIAVAAADQDLSRAGELMFRAEHLAGAVLELLAKDPARLTTEEFLQFNCIIDACRDHLRVARTIVQQKAATPLNEGCAA